MQLSDGGGGKARWYTHLGKQLGGFFKNLNMYLPYDMIIPILEIYQEEWKHVSIEGPVHECYWQLYLLQPKAGNLTVHQQSSG